MHFWGEGVTTWGQEIGCLSVTLTQSLSSVPLASFLTALRLSFPGVSNKATSESWYKDYMRNSLLKGHVPHTYSNCCKQ